MATVLLLMTTTTTTVCTFSLTHTGRSDQSVVARAVLADLEYLGLQTSKHPSSVLFDRSKCVWRGEWGRGSGRVRGWSS
jgi:hypothetical protein